MLRTIPVVIPAGVGQSPGLLPIKGDFLFVIESSSQFTLRINGIDEVTPVERGFIFKEDFNSLHFSNNGAAAVTVLIAVGLGASMQDYRPNVKSQIPSDVTTVVNAAINVTTQATATLVAAADAARVELIITAASTNTSFIRLQANQAGDKIIKTLNPGEILKLQYTGVIYAWAGLVGQSLEINATRY